MAKRNIFKMAEKTTGRIPERYDITASELVALKDLAKEDPLEALGVAFRSGFVLGHRATKASEYKESR